jgi:hypothetical protein
METELASQPEFDSYPCHPVSPFGDFLAHMAEMGAGEWVWPVMDICSRYGVFCADERRCMVARPVDSSFPIGVLNDFRDLEPDGDYLLTMEPDAWHIVYASGDIRNFFDLAPYELPKLIWQRNGEGQARIYDYQRTKKKVMASQPKITAPPKPDPSTLASTADNLASREAELERKRRGMFYSGFRRQGTSAGVAPMGGDSQQLG